MDFGSSVNLQSVKGSPRGISAMNLVKPMDTEGPLGFCGN